LAQDQAVLMWYEDFDLLAVRTEGGYRTRVFRSLAGEAQVAFGQDRFSNHLEPEGFGAELYETAFSDGGGERLIRIRNEATRRKLGLRVRIHAPSLKLAVFPQECLRITSAVRFPRLSPEIPILRYLELVQRPQPVATHLSLEALAVFASPKDQLTIAI
jgi:hypothetical protein